MNIGSWITRESLRLVVLVLPFIFLFLFWDQLPDSKSWQEGIRILATKPIGKFHLTVLALLNLVLYGGFQLLHFFLAKKTPHPPTRWQILQLLCHQLLALTFFLEAFRALGFRLAPFLVLQYGIITLLLVLGSFLATIPRNSVFGFRLSWTLKSDAIWQKTHRFAAQVWVCGSFLMLFYANWQTHDWVFPLYVGLLVLLPIIYSFFAYQQHLKTLARPKK